MPQLPPITHLQFVILRALHERNCSGRELREVLRHHGQETGRVAFYRLMARMEDAKLVDGRYVTSRVNGVGAKERWYSIGRDGKSHFQETLHFYRVDIKAAKSKAASIV